MPNDAVVVGEHPTGSEVQQRPESLKERPLVARLIRNVWIWPPLVMAVFGLFRIGRPQMWQDELVTISIAPRPTRHIFHLLSNVDAVHGAYYLFMHGWIRAFGESPTALRVPSALAMMVAALSVTLTAQLLFDRWVGLLSGGVFVLVPSVTRFAQEARSYAFVVMFVALATLLLVLAVRRSGLGLWAGYAACLTAITCLNTVALSTTVGYAVGLFALVEAGRRRRAFVTFGLATLAGVLPASPVIYFGLAQASRQIVWIGHEAAWLVWPRTVASAWLSWIVLGLGLVAVAVHRRRALFGFAVAAVPLLVIWLVSLGELNYFFSKYLLFTIPGWAVLAGAGLSVLRWKPLVAAALAGLALLTVPDQRAIHKDLSHAWYTYPQVEPRPPLAYRDAAYLIARNYQPGDGIVYTRQLWWFMHDEGVSYYLPPDVKPRDIFLRSSADEAGDLTATECAVPAECVGSERRVWIVVPYWSDDPIGQMLHPQGVLFFNDFRVVRMEHPSGMTVALIQHV